ncbi:MAG: hypothetical protein IT223_03855 [Crocinitomicaceae bacterium]|nr:hypothetical protein [Crocinitomicaceae bacterium]
MKQISILLFLILTFNVANAKKKGSAEGGFVLEGQIMETDIINGDRKPAPMVQIVIYQEKEIYVAFYSDATGNYKFLLPGGHDYEVWFGGSSYVNKKVNIDAKECSGKNTSTHLLLDIELFRPVDGYDFFPLNDAYAQIAWDHNGERFISDRSYEETKERELDKIFRKIKKANPKGT